MNSVEALTVAMRYLTVRKVRIDEARARPTCTARYFEETNRELEDLHAALRTLEALRQMIADQYGGLEAVATISDRDVFAGKTVDQWLR